MKGMEGEHNVPMAVAARGMCIVSKSKTLGRLPEFSI